MVIPFVVAGNEHSRALHQPSKRCRVQIPSAEAQGLAISIIFIDNRVRWNDLFNLALSVLVHNQTLYGEWLHTLHVIGRAPSMRESAETGSRIQ
jgi:hypothetical protein